jgi:hypothetical protein
VRISALKVVLASFGFSGSFLGLSGGFLIYDSYYLLSPQEVPKNFRAEILTIFSLLFEKIDVFQNSF